MALLRNWFLRSTGSSVLQSARDGGQSLALRNIALCQTLYDTHLALTCLGNQPGTNTARTDLHPDGFPFLQRTYLVKIRVPDFAGLVVGMAHIVAEDRTFPADIADFCHG